MKTLKTTLACLIYFFTHSIVEMIFTPDYLFNPRDVP